MEYVHEKKVSNNAKYQISLINNKVHRNEKEGETTNLYLGDPL